ncbi:MAG: DsrE/DsrF/DrsH-like family protein, partial [Candidatus Margulisiibacteriota bacterium]
MEKEKFNVVVFSGDLDKVLAAFILATTAASMGMEVNMFFTFWGLNVLRKKSLISGKNWLQKLMSFLNRGGADRLPLSKFNMF